jgi:hypothetical protein
MIEAEDDHPYVEMIARDARRPVAVDPAARARIMDLVRAEPIPRRTVWGRLLQPRALTLSPLASMALAAGLVGIGLLIGPLVFRRDGLTKAGQSTIVASPEPKLPASDTVVTFVFAGQASAVSLVGDFNGWDATATPMKKLAPNGAYWSVTLPLSVGRHLYAFVVDSQWIADQHAPLAPDDGFGRPNSVRLVGRGPSL